MTTPRYTCDTQWFRSSDGSGLLAGSPLTFFRVSRAGAVVLDAIENGTDLPGHHSALTDRLLAAGAIHPEVDPGRDHPGVTVVIPAFITTTADHELLAALVSGLGGLDVIVVDDASPSPIELSGVRIIRHDHNQGPGPSRNTGLASVGTALVAFVDSDTIVTPDNIESLASLLSDPSVALVAPRVRTPDEGTVTSEYDSWRSPLDLGDQPAVVRPMSRVPYVPSAVLVARVEALRNVGGFDESIRVGEDVDLIWRLVATGALCLYAPSVECSHRARPTVRAMLRQRFTYGTSAAILDKNHPGAATPLRSNALLLMMAVLILSGNWLTATALSVPVLAFFAVILRVTRLSILTRVRLTWMGFTSTTRLLASAVMRAWWPLFFIGSTFSPQLTAMVTFSAIVPATVGLVRRKPRRPISFFILRIADDLAYGAGVWRGALRHRNARCLLPTITFRRSTSTPPA